MKAIIYSPLSPADCLEKIKRETDTRSFIVFDSGKKFIGRINENKFRIKLNSFFRRSLFPAITYGEVLSDDMTGSKIMLRSTIPPISLVVLGFFLFVFYLVSSETSMFPHSDFDVFFVLALVAVIIISLAVYSYDASKTMLVLEKLVNPTRKDL
jgi:hypothetical protein